MHPLQDFLEFSLWAFTVTLVTSGLYFAAVHGVVWVGEDHQIRSEESPWLFRFTVMTQLLFGAYLAHAAAVATGLLGG